MDKPFKLPDNISDYERGFIDGMQKQMQSSVDRIVNKLAQPEPEPVAWRFDQAKYRENDLRGRQWAFNVFSQTKPYMDEMVRNVTPLYIAPPQRKEWQGLTDADIDDVQYNVDCRLYRDYARAIEAKLREKNT